MEKRTNAGRSRQAPKKRGGSAVKRLVLGVIVILFVMLTGIGCGFLTASMNTRPNLAEDLTPSASSQIYDINGNEIANIHATENRMPVKISQIPKDLQNAFIAVEDARFYEHSGIDPRGIMRALWANISGGGVSEGGSTITQQLAKNAYLTPERTIKRKIQEMFLALQLEREYTKQEILEFYLNQIYFGQGAYGVEAGDVIDKVFCIDVETGEEVVFAASECAYGYRDSRFKHEKGRYIVVKVTFRLRRAYSPSLGYGNIKAALEGRDLSALTPSDVRDAIIRIRREKLPDPAETGSAGSFFKNPVISREHYERIVASTPDGKVPHYDLPDGMVKVPAAWLIDTCGFRGAVKGGAKVYDKQPLVIVNATGSASPSDIISLENDIISAVRSRFAIDLHPEVEHI